MISSAFIPDATLGHKDRHALNRGGGEKGRGGGGGGEEERRGGEKEEKGGGRGGGSAPRSLEAQSRRQLGVVQHLKTVLQLLQVTVYKQLGAHEVTVRG